MEGEGGRVEGNRIELAKNKLILYKIYSTLLLPLSQSKRIINDIKCILSFGLCHFLRLNKNWRAQYMNINDHETQLLANKTANNQA